MSISYFVYLKLGMGRQNKREQVIVRKEGRERRRGEKKRKEERKGKEETESS